MTEQRLVPAGGASPLRLERKRMGGEAYFTGFRRRGRTWRLMRSGNMGGEARSETATEPSHGSREVSTRRPNAVTQRVSVATDKPVAEGVVGGRSPARRRSCAKCTVARKDDLAAWGSRGVAKPEGPVIGRRASVARPAMRKQPER